MENIKLAIPTKIYFGENILVQALAEVMLPDKVMLVTGGRATRRHGYTNKIIEAVDSEVVIFDKISPNPKTAEIDAAINVGLGVKAVIGLGGGSAIDAAKIIAAGIGMGVKTEDFLCKGVVPDEKTLPIIAVPTTAGTGSELSKGAILTDEMKTLKTGIRGENLFPKVAIIDPSLTYTVPKIVTIDTGFDVLAHAIESFISNKSNEFSRMISVEVIAGVGEYLPKLIQNIDVQKARNKMSYYSMLVGINVGNTGNALPHRLQYPIGAHTDTSHGAGLRAIYRAWIESTYKYSEDKFNQVMSHLSRNNIRSKEEALEAFKIFMDKIEGSITLDVLGLQKADVDRLVSEVSGDINSDPAACESGVIKKIYESAFESRR